MTTSNCLIEVDILDKVSLNLNVIDNPYNFKLEDIVDFGLRINPKRNFLFISKLLGKHLSSSPEVVKITGGILAYMYAKKYNLDNDIHINKLINAIKTKKYDNIRGEYFKTVDIKEKTLIIGFGETATGISQATSSYLNGSYFIHTTREELLDENKVFSFEEEHSHATSHNCYIEDIKILDNIERVILIDDELTTGKTFLNLIKSIKSKTNINNFTVITLLDFRNKEWLNYCDSFINNNNIKLDVLYLLKAEVTQIKGFDIKELELEEEKINKSIDKNIEIITHPMAMDFYKKFKTKNGYRKYSLCSGRYGINQELYYYYDSMEEFVLKGDIEKYLEKDKVLILGFGEFIYFPSMIASYINLDKEVIFKSFTRSPIYVSNKEGYPIKNKIEFFIDNVKYYLYNIEEDIEEVVVFFDYEFNEKHINSIINAFKVTNVNKIILYSE